MNESVIIQKLIQVGQMLQPDELEYSSAEADIKYYLEQYAALRQTDVSSRFIYLITNETDMTVESAWSNFEEAKKECQQWEKMKPQKQFMVVELPINDR
jgi:hypothetical protein